MSWVSSYLNQLLIVSNLQNQSVTDRQTDKQTNRQDNYYNPLVHARWGLITGNTPRQPQIEIPLHVSHPSTFLQNKFSTAMSPDSPCSLCATWVWLRQTNLQLSLTNFIGYKTKKDWSRQCWLVATYITCRQAWCKMGKTNDKKYERKESAGGKEHWTWCCFSHEKDI